MSINQSLTLIRLCGSLMIEEKPEIRIELVQKIWKTLMELGMRISSSCVILRSVYAGIVEMISLF